MTIKENLKKWESYSSKFVPPKPVGFSEDKYVFDVTYGDVPSGLQGQMASKDLLASLRFANRKSDDMLGPLDCPLETLKKLTAFLASSDKKRMAFGCELGTGEPLHVVSETDLSGRDVWFIGDIHGDLMSFRSVISFINSNSTKKPIYVLLGDLLDRNPYGLNVLMDVVALLMESPDSVFILPGNHDDGLSWTGTDFQTSITPRQFTDYLNEIRSPIISEFVRGFIRLVQVLPVGVIFPNGLFVTHGGVPSRPERQVKNVWEGMNAAEIKKFMCEHRREFLMNRFKWENVPLASKVSPEFSWIELVNFSRAVEKAYGVTVRSILRGHDHCDLCRHEHAKSNFNGNDRCSPEDANLVRDALTMTTMMLVDDGEKRLPGFFRHETSYPTIACYEAGEKMPRVFSLEFSDKEVAGYYDRLSRKFGDYSAGFVSDYIDSLIRDEKKQTSEFGIQNAQHRDKIKEIEKKCASLNETKNRKEKSVSDLKNKKAECEKEIDKLSDKIEDINSKGRKKDGIFGSSLENLQKDLSEKKKIKDKIQADLNQETSDLQNYNKQLNEYETEKSKEKASISMLEKLEKDLLNLRNDIRRFETIKEKFRNIADGKCVS